MIVDPYLQKTLKERAIFSLDRTVLPMLPELYEGVVIPVRRWIYDLAVRGRVNRLVSERLAEWPSVFTNIEIETVNRCNNDCPFCPANRGADRRAHAVMGRRLFTSIVRQLGEIGFRGNLALYSNNEPLLDPRIAELAREARGAVPGSFIYIFTNGTLLTPGLYTELMGSLDLIVINNYSDDLKLLPQVREIERASRSDPGRYGRTKIVLRRKSEFRTNRAGQSPNRRRRLGLTSACIYPFSQMVVRPDGKLSLCCNDAWGATTMGDLSETAILDCWFGERYKEARRKIIRGRKCLSPCRECDNLTTGHIEEVPLKLGFN
ncbi:MAG: SPASM domain-containing protein [Candidatus Verstraetearchaeota archaeon]|nr:SPASM domain-containing protein [Candidatus Verstraetearchaeota archaeon]